MNRNLAHVGFGAAGFSPENREEWRKLERTEGGSHLLKGRSERSTLKRTQFKNTIKVQTLPLTSAAVRRKTASPSLSVAGRRNEDARERKRHKVLVGLREEVRR